MPDEIDLIYFSIINMLFDTFNKYEASNTSINITGHNLEITIYYWHCKPTTWPTIWQALKYNLNDPQSLPNAKKQIDTLIDQHTIDFNER